MRRLAILVALMAALACGPALADPARGWAAYLKGNYAAALSELKPLAERGNADAQYYYGTMFSDGLGVPRNNRAAAEWYEKAARQGHTDAQFSLGFLLLYGAGDGADAVDSNIEAGLGWLEKSGAHGNAQAQYFLGSLYWGGNTVPHDHDRALNWTLLAAEQGFVPAQYQAGVILAHTPGVVNAINSYRWLELAARGGDPAAPEARDKMAAERLSADEIQQARMLADAWRAR
jgi:TPR repeat protein